jgi:ribosome maturation factor RimP
MLKKNIMEQLIKLGEETVNPKDYELVDVEFVKEAGNWYLRYYIDKEGGITIDDCQVVSEELSEKLDIIDPIPHSYILEVSSPGIERPLKSSKDFLRHIGAFIEIKTYEPIDGKKIFSGTLKNYADDIITICDKQDIDIPRDKISSARLKF